ncbi:hypothetical protein DVP38_21220 [Yersinia enterocolitica]|nr:hypothetical protein [Yersinia enterocolitica]
MENRYNGKYRVNKITLYYRRTFSETGQPLGIRSFLYLKNQEAVLVKTSKIIIKQINEFVSQMCKQL